MASPWLAAASLALIFCSIATAFNLLVPLYEAPDEHAHVAYVDYIKRNASIPEVTAETNEAAGPPLYHAIGAGVLELLGLSAPQIEIPGNPDSSSKPNFFLHTPAEDHLPFRGPVLSIHILRAISTLFGAGAVVFVYLIVRLLFPGRPLLAWSAGANTALLPQFAFAGGAVMNDMTIAFFSAAAVYCSFRVMRDGSWVWLLPAAGSLSLGFLTEASMAVAAAVCALAVLFSPLSWQRRAMAIGILAGAPLLFAGWFYVGHLVKYGEVYPIHAIRAAIPSFGPGLPLNHPNYRGPFQSSLDRSYWFVGGYMNVYVAGAMYQFLDILAGMALGGTILVIVRRGLSPFQQRGILLLGVLLVVTALMIVWVSTVISYQPQGRYLFQAQPAIALLLALGLTTIFQRDTVRDNAAAFLLPVILFGLNLGILTLTLPSAY